MATMNHVCWWCGAALPAWHNPWLDWPICDTCDGDKPMLSLTAILRAVDRLSATEPPVEVRWHLGEIVLHREGHISFWILPRQVEGVLHQLQAPRRRAPGWESSRILARDAGGEIVLAQDWQGSFHIPRQQVPGVIRQLQAIAEAHTPPPRRKTTMQALLMEVQ